LREALRDADPVSLAERVGGVVSADDRIGIWLSLWASPIMIRLPDLIAVNESDQPLNPMIQAILLYHLVTGDGSPLEGRWVSFADLPGGRMYAQAFQGYTGDEIVKSFGLNLESFERACQKIGGTKINAADSAFMFLCLPRLPIVLTYWLGDEDFPSSCKVLFDASACHYLPIDGCAIAGSMLTSRVLKAR
jgi:hypothetical protein